MKTAVTTLGMAIALTACGGGGGGGDNTGPAPATSAEGMYHGTTSNNRQIDAFVLDDGTYYVMYSVSGSSAMPGGVVVGSGTSKNGSFSSDNARDFNLEGLGIVSGNVSASYTQKKSLNGTIAYTNGTGSATFTGNYDADYEKTPALTSIAGSYSGFFVSSFGQGGSLAPVSLTLAGGGAANFSGVLCSSTGTVATRVRGNVYNVTATFAGTDCALAGQLLSGMAYFNSTDRSLRGMLTTSDRKTGYLFDVTKK
ncbi:MULTISPECIES: hypothetical protein [Paraburkholderia]|uniref:hypothetical protein n=1 Tax=Paraburkholderia TaxID=1822464 RepID=UPI0022556419|nr:MULTISPECIES: hypothetical protein [Paraburkholderia]MCX4164486.1 hypothetical protein [Paraburkholderia megapolitana]MDN7159979.1 hypothetical protein [Paraburkholderia sp. CHISQ3]MDQ6497026.1 hypothetical protein [Paraburkholderia megapolitana]